jgi:hypothetical protein
VLEKSQYESNTCCAVVFDFEGQSTRMRVNYPSRFRAGDTTDRKASQGGCRHVCVLPRAVWTMQACSLFPACLLALTPE